MDLKGEVGEEKVWVVYERERGEAAALAMVEEGARAAATAWRSQVGEGTHLC